MAKPKALEMKGIINKVIRLNGKAEAQMEAQMMVTVPVSAAGDIPLGEVHITLEETQTQLFKGPIRGAKHPKGGLEDEEDDEDDL